MSRVALNPQVEDRGNLPDIKSEYATEVQIGNLLQAMELRDKFESDTVRIQVLGDAEMVELSAEVLENSSCRGTQKMTNRREFSFFDS